MNSDLLKQWVEFYETYMPYLEKMTAPIGLEAPWSAHLHQEQVVQKVLLNELKNRRRND